MKTKQIISIVITGVVIIAVGITGVASNVIGSKLIKQNKTETSSIVKDMFSSVSGDSNIELPNKDFVGVINIEGEIGASSSNSLTSDSTYNHDFYLKYIEKMEKSDKNKGILLYVDSPEELFMRVMRCILNLWNIKKRQKDRYGHILHHRLAQADIISQWQQIRFMQTGIAGRVLSAL